ncbi:NAD(P)/FAD-dependent oxidoreductase [Pseudobacteriovorax antillogorgiicola]|uniref:Glycine/D-amino acid oxidase n=1 Tax=Pseudobacteriovorax antillogorgiicola TaxID=1513793 RepID=A0A1Y6B6T7_9BACT|nr:FAD-binding oxidoreductase [Pseudobacteriovorax antillogorgiicola]TCS59138.1 glycine/D-amino acid oxidase-like deaminating enzyme [Pseudobacteriovorax antillogorgiicola]SME91288.1 Glycine/D-amino acid oxidase [Pseudobacteriovorax antillogorgiicola]
MTHKFKIAIVGDGISGLSTARSLKLRSPQSEITLIRNPKKHPRASDAAQGVVCNKGLLFPRMPLFEAKLKSLAWVKKWLKDIESLSGKTIPKDFSAVCEPYFDLEQFQKLVKRVYKGNFWGCFQTEHYRGSFASWTLPMEGYLKYPSEGWFHCPSALEAIRFLLSNEGCRFIDESVDRISLRGADLDLWMNGEPHAFDRVILAAGFDTLALCDRSNISFPFLKDVCGHTLSCRSKRDLGQSIVVSGTKSLIVRNHEFFVGSSSRRGQNLSSKELVESIGELEDYGRTLIQDFDMVRSGTSPIWGVRSCTKDRMPYFGSIPEEGWAGKLFSIGGMYKNGLQLGPYLGEALAALVTAQDIPKLAENFRLERFYPD